MWTTVAFVSKMCLVRSLGIMGRATKVSQQPDPFVSGTLYCNTDSATRRVLYTGKTLPFEKGANTVVNLPPLFHLGFQLLSLGRHQHLVSLFPKDEDHQPDSSSLQLVMSGLRTLSRRVSKVHGSIYSWLVHLSSCWCFLWLLQPPVHFACALFLL